VKGDSREAAHTFGGVRWRNGCCSSGDDYVKPLIERLLRSGWDESSAACEERVVSSAFALPTSVNTQATVLLTDAPVEQVPAE
jgi:hypothetical protein